MNVLNTDKERKLAQAAFMPVRPIGMEETIVTLLWNNHDRPTLYKEMLAWHDSRVGEVGALNLVLVELKERGVIETVRIGGRDVYDLTYDFRDLVMAEQTRYRRDVLGRPT